MNIKSDNIVKSIKNGLKLNIVALMIAIIGAILLSILIINTNETVWWKLGTICVGFGITLILTYEQGDRIKRVDEFKQNSITLLLIMVLTEIILFYRSNVITRIELDIITKPKTEKINYVVDGKITPTVRPFTIIEYYSNENNTKIGSKKVYDNKKIKLYTNITAQEIYYEYFPFVTFEKKTRFIKDTK